MEELEFLKEQNVSGELIRSIEEFRKNYKWMKLLRQELDQTVHSVLWKRNPGNGHCRTSRRGKPSSCRPKATGKNILAENLAYAFGRPVYNVSFHVNTNSGDLIGTDTFVNNEVCLRKGSIYQCAEYGGFGILDEINMAKNDAVSVLHATLDYRRSIDVPGYDRNRPASCSTFYRNNELWICRNKRAQRSTCIQIPGDRHAGSDRGNIRFYL